ncbi:hypothetical protein Tco_0735878 [Tanacetum coccineum]
MVVGLGWTLAWVVGWVIGLGGWVRSGGRLMVVVMGADMAGGGWAWRCGGGLGHGGGYSDGFYGYLLEGYSSPLEDLLVLGSLGVDAASHDADDPYLTLLVNPEEDSRAVDDDGPEEDPADYPDDRDDGEEGEEESSGHNVDDDEKDEDEEEEEEEHLALADSVPPPIHRVTAWMSVQAQTPISLPSDYRRVCQILCHTILPPPSHSLLFHTIP